MPTPNIDSECARFEGPYVESADLIHGKPVTVTISEVIPPNTERAADKRLIDKPILAFSNAKKRFICGKTNVRIIKAMYGKKPSEWIGKTITIGVRYLKHAFGEVNVPTLRVIPPPGTHIPMGARRFFGKATPWTDEEMRSK